MPDVDVAVIINRHHAADVVNVAQVHDGMLVLAEQFCLQVLTHQVHAMTFVLLHMSTLHTHCDENEGET